MPGYGEIQAHEERGVELIPCWCFFLIYPKNEFIAPCVYIVYLSFNKRRYLYQVAFGISHIAGALAPRLCCRGKDRLRSHVYRAVILLVNISKRWNIEGQFHCAISTIRIGILMRCHLLECFAREHDDTRCAERHLHIWVGAIPFSFESEDVTIECNHPGIVGGKKSNGVELEMRFRLRHHLGKLHEPHLVERLVYLYLLWLVVFQQREYLACKLKVSTAICCNDILVAYSLCVDIAGGIGVCLPTPQLQLLNAIACMADFVEKTFARHP